MYNIPYGEKKSAHICKRDNRISVGQQVHTNEGACLPGGKQMPPKPTPSLSPCNITITTTTTAAASAQAARQFSLKRSSTRKNTARKKYLTQRNPHTITGVQTALARPAPAQASLHKIKTSPALPPARQPHTLRNLNIHCSQKSPSHHLLCRRQTLKPPHIPVTCCRASCESTRGGNARNPIADLDAPNFGCTPC